MEVGGGAGGPIGGPGRDQPIPADVGPIGTSPDEIHTVIRRKEDGEVHKLTTIPVDLPAPVVEALHKHGVKIKIPDIVRRFLPDQAIDMMSTDGCISSPGGPGC